MNGPPVRRHISARGEPRRASRRRRAQRESGGACLLRPGSCKSNSARGRLARPPCAAERRWSMGSCPHATTAPHLWDPIPLVCRESIPTGLLIGPSLRLLLLQLVSTFSLLLLADSNLATSIRNRDDAVADYTAALIAARCCSPKCLRTKSCIFFRATFDSGASGILDAKLCGMPS